MAFLSFTLTALLSAANPSDAPAEMACRFEAEDTPATWISVRPEAETARPGLFRVRLWIEGRSLAGSAIALEKTEARDVVVRGTTPDATTWLIAIRDNGKAYLQTKAAEEDAVALAQAGECTRYRDAFDMWLAS